MAAYFTRNKSWLDPYKNLILTHLKVKYYRIRSVLEAIHCKFEGLARHYKMERENPAKIAALRISRILITRHHKVCIFNFPITITWISY